MELRFNKTKGITPVKNDMYILHLQNKVDYQIGKVSKEVANSKDFSPKNDIEYKEGISHVIENYNLLVHENFFQDTPKDNIAGILVSKEDFTVIPVTANGNIVTRIMQLHTRATLVLITK